MPRRALPESGKKRPKKLGRDFPEIFPEITE